VFFAAMPDVTTRIERIHKLLGQLGAETIAAPEAAVAEP
jgi:hypothetical protein